MYRRYDITVKDDLPSDFFPDYQYVAFNVAEDYLHKWTIPDLVDMFRFIGSDIDEIVINNDRIWLVYIYDANSESASLHMQDSFALQARLERRHNHWWKRLKRWFCCD